MLSLIVFIAVFVALTMVLFKERQDHKTMLLLFILGFTIYSGLGLVLFEVENATVYSTNFAIFSLAFLGVGVLTKDMTSSALERTGRMTENHRYIVIFMAVLYIVTYIYPLVLGEITLEEFLDIASVFSEYEATPFALRLERKSNVIYTLMVNQIRSICRPFFYIVLYWLRRKPVIFSLLYIVPVYCMTIADGYISRNNLAVYVAFLAVYLVMEGFISKKMAVPMAIVGVPLVLALFNAMAGLRQGENFSLSSSTIGQNIQELIDSECSYPRYYRYCTSMTNLGTTLSFFIYIALVCIPSQFYAPIGLNPPDLAYDYTEYILGMAFGDQGYYIMLPSVLGEAIILLGNHFAWLYGAFYAALVFWFLRVLSGHESIKYLKLYFVLDFFRQFRGGSQYVLSTWLTTLIPLIIIVYVLSRVKFVSGKSNLSKGAIRK